MDRQATDQELIEIEELLNISSAGAQSRLGAHKYRSDHDEVCFIIWPPGCRQNDCWT